VNAEATGRGERVVSVYLYGLGGFMMLTAISPLFMVSWPYLALASVPTQRWFRRRRLPLTLVITRWIFGIAVLLLALPLTTGVVYLSSGYVRSETWGLLGTALAFVPFVVASGVVFGHGRRSTW
jgi:hypothetical protein